jgi:hypothetical protein
MVSYLRQYRVRRAQAGRYFGAMSASPDKRTFIDATVTTLALTDWKR